MPSRSLLVHGTSNILTKVAGCCAPVPGDPIGGYVTVRGSGISIHRRDCRNLKELAALRPHKLVEVAWGEKSGPRPAAPRMEKADRIENKSVKKQS
jgi:GTP pyrophosphokinase